MSAERARRDGGLTRALVLVAVTAGCPGSRGGPSEIAEARGPGWRAVLRCDVRRTALGVGTVPTDATGPRPAYAGRVVLEIECGGRVRGRTVLPTGAREDDDRTKLLTACQRFRGRIATSMRPEGVVVAAGLDGDGVSAVLLRAHDGRVRAVDTPAIAGDPTRAARAFVWPAGRE
jgi:hypothetical protein